MLLRVCVCVPPLKTGGYNNTMSLGVMKVVEGERNGKCQICQCVGMWWELSKWGSFRQHYPRERPSLCDFVDWLTPLCFYVPPHPHNKAQAASSPTELLGITLATSSR